MQHKLLVTLFFITLCGVVAQPPQIWSIVGGEIGLGSLYNIVTEAVTFPGLAFTYKLNNTVTAYGKEYIIPDQCFGYNSPQFVNDSRMLLVDTYQYYYNNYVSTWGISAGVNIDGVNLDFAFSHTRGQINEYLQHDTNMFAENKLTWSEFHLEMWPGQSVLNPTFQKYIDQLPEEYDQKIYLNFVETFGTHIIDRVWYGALLNFTSIFEAKLIGQTSIEWVENQVKLSIGYMEFNAGINWSGFNNKTHIDQKFLEHSRNLTVIVGGQPAWLVAGDFKKWWESVETQSAIIFPMSNIKPIYTYVSNPKIAANIKKATIAYGTGQMGNHLPLDPKTRDPPVPAGKMRELNSPKK